MPHYSHDSRNPSRPRLVTSPAAADTWPPLGPPRRDRRLCAALLLSGGKIQVIAHDARTERSLSPLVEHLARVLDYLEELKEREDEAFDDALEAYRDQQLRHAMGE